MSLKEAIECLNTLDDSDLEDVNLDESEDEWLPSHSPDVSQLSDEDDEEEDEDSATTKVVSVKVVKEKKKDSLVKKALSITWH